MNKQTEALKEAKQWFFENRHELQSDWADSVAKLIDEALEQPAQEPVDVARVQVDGSVEWRPDLPDLPVGTKLYTHPAPAPAQEPVAWMHRHEGEITEFNDFQSCDKCEPLYTHPAPSFIGLSDDEVQDVFNLGHKTFKEFARAFEQALKERNT